MPVSVAYGTAVIVGQLLPHPATASMVYFWSWLGVNAVATICLGLLDRKLGYPATSFHEAVPHVATFLLLQLLIVPVVLGVLMLANFHVD